MNLQSLILGYNQESMSQILLRCLKLKQHLKKSQEESITEVENVLLIPLKC